MSRPYVKIDADLSLRLLLPFLETLHDCIYSLYLQGVKNAYAQNRQEDSMRFALKSNQILDVAPQTAFKYNFIFVVVRNVISTKDF